MSEQRNDVAVVDVDQGAVVHGRRRTVLVRRRSWAGAGEAGDKGGEAASCSGFERAMGAAGAARDLTRWRDSWWRRRGPTRPPRPRGPGMHQNVLAGSGKLWQAWQALAGFDRRRLALAGDRRFETEPGGRHLGCRSARLAADFQWVGALPRYKLQGAMEGFGWIGGRLFL